MLVKGSPVCFHSFGAPQGRRVRTRSTSATAGAQRSSEKATVLEGAIQTLSLAYS